MDCNLDYFEAKLTSQTHSCVPLFPEAFLLCGRAHYLAQRGHSHPRVLLICRAPYVTNYNDKLPHELALTPSAILFSITCHLDHMGQSVCGHTHLNQAFEKNLVRANSLTRMGAFTPVYMLLKNLIIE